MKNEITPSQTALFSAAARAAHPLVDQFPHLLNDDVSARLCKTTSPSPLDFQLAQPGADVLAAARLSACARARYAETVLSESRIEQLVVIGAGLDTTASRVRPELQEQVWLIDRPGVLVWRSQLFDAAGLNDSTHHIGMDLAEGLDLRELQAEGVDLRRPVFVLWLGVSMYLSAQDFRNFITDLAGLPDGSSLVFDYHLPPELRDEAGADYACAVAAMAGREGEPWQCSAAPETVEAWLSELGWRIHEDIDEARAVPDGFLTAQEHLSPMRLVRLVHAVR